MTITKPVMSCDRALRHAKPRRQRSSTRLWTAECFVKCVLLELGSDCWLPCLAASFLRLWWSCGPISQATSSQPTNKRRRNGQLPRSCSVKCFRTSPSQWRAHSGVHLWRRNTATDQCPSDYLNEAIKTLDCHAATA